MLRIQDGPEVKRPPNRRSLQKKNLPTYDLHFIEPGLQDVFYDPKAKKVYS